MHDPKTVAFELRRPEVRSSKLGMGGKRLWLSLVTVWHVEPGNRDTRPHPCGSTRWRWHVHHWRLQVVPLQRIVHWFVRCDGCGRRMGRSPRFGQWGGGKRVWHMDCFLRQHAKGVA